MRRILSIHLRGLHVEAARRGAEIDGGVTVIVSRDGELLDATPDLFDRGATMGMPVRKAARLCPVAVLPENEPEAEALSRRAFDILASRTPLVERVDFHCGFIDVAGCYPNSESLSAYVELIRSELRSELDLDPQIGGGSTCEAAEIAMRRTPDGFVPRMRSDERRMIHAAPVAHCPEMSRELVKRFDRLGVYTLGDAAGLPLDQLIRLAGKKDGWRLHRLSHCEPVRTLRPNYPPQDIEVSEAFDPTDHAPQVVAIFQRLIDRANAQVHGALPMEVVVTLGVFGVGPRTARFRFARDDLAASARAFRAERMLFDLWQGEELESVALTFTSLRPFEARQTRLWDEEKRRRRAQCLDLVARVQARFSLRSLLFAASEEMSVLAPPVCFSAEAFHQTGLCPQGCGMFQ